MGGKLNLYNLGDLGVHLVETPVHSPDGSFTSAQNASVSQNQGQHGIRKRHGMTKLNASALNGSIRAISNMPFQDPFPAIESSGTRLLTNEYNEGPSAAFVSTTNGTTWAAGDGPGHSWAYSIFNLSFTQRGGVLSEAGVLTFFTNFSSADRLVTWDGTTLTTIASNIPTAAGFVPVAAPLRHTDGFIYLCLTDNSTAKLCRYVGGAVGDELEVVTDAIGKGGVGLASALARVYIGTQENRIYYWSESEGLVLDLTISATGGNVSVTDIAVSNGVIYAACCTKSGGSTATTHKVLKRTADATWSDITPQAQGNYGPMAAFGGVLYVVRKAHGSFAGCEIRSYDGSSWTTDLDVTSIATGATNVLGLVVWNGVLYGTVATSTTRDVIRRSGGSWSKVRSESNGGTTALYTAIGFY